MRRTFLLIFLLAVILIITFVSVKFDNINVKKDSNSVSQRIMEQKDKDKEFAQFEIGGWLNKWYDKNITGKGIKIAVLDTGVDMSSKDLSIIKGVNFVGDNSADYNDDNGHGTKIAGVIGARKNDFNLIGIAPDSDLYIAKVANKHGNVRYEDLVEGIRWAIEQKVDLINISLEFEEDNNALYYAIKEAIDNNIIIIASSGNVRFEGDTYSSYPGSYSEVIAVGMLDDYGQIYSDEFKNKKVDVYAPGEDIAALYLNNKMTLDTGVSFATAYTTGYSALIIQSNKEKNKIMNRAALISQLKNDLETNLSFGLENIILITSMILRILLNVFIIGWTIFALTFWIRKLSNKSANKFPIKLLVLSISFILVLNITIFVFALSF